MYGSASALWTQSARKQYVQATATRHLLAPSNPVTSYVRGIDLPLFHTRQNAYNLLPLGSYAVLIENLATSIRDSFATGRLTLCYLPKRRAAIKFVLSEGSILPRI